LEYFYTFGLFYTFLKQFVYLSVGRVKVVVLSIVERHSGIWGTVDALAQGETLALVQSGRWILEFKI
jgi:hypothetical protein